MKVEIENLESTISEFDNMLSEQKIGFNERQKLCESIKHILTKYKLSNEGEFIKEFTSKYDDFIINGNWSKSKNSNKDEKFTDVSKVEYIEKLKDDGNVLRHIYMNYSVSSIRATLYDEIQRECKNQYCNAFIKINMPEGYVNGSWQEGVVINDLRKVYNADYQYRANDIFNKIVSWYTKKDVLELFT